MFIAIVWTYTYHWKNFHTSYRATTKYIPDTSRLTSFEVPPHRCVRRDITRSTMWKLLSRKTYVSVVTLSLSLDSFFCLYTRARNCAVCVCVFYSFVIRVYNARAWWLLWKNAALGNQRRRVIALCALQLDFLFPSGRTEVKGELMFCDLCVYTNWILCRMRCIILLFLNIFQNTYIFSVNCIRIY